MLKNHTLITLCTHIRLRFAFPVCPGLRQTMTACLEENLKTSSVLIKLTMELWGEQ